MKNEAFDSTVIREVYRAYRKDDLAFWKRLLKPEIYSELEKFALDESGGIRRGDDLVSFLFSMT